MTEESRLLDAAFTIFNLRTTEGVAALKTAHGRKVFAYCANLIKGTKWEPLLDDAPMTWEKMFEDDDET